MARLVTLHDTDGEIIYPQTISDMDYSTSEQDTGCKWIDGKPIYKKTVFFSSIASGDRDTAHGISNISKIIRHEAFFVTSGTYKQLPIFANTSGGNHACVWGVNSTAFNTVSTMALSDFYITIWYTKTTD